MSRQTKTQKTGVKAVLNEDVLVLISQFATVESVRALSNCSKLHHDCLTKPLVWKQLVLRDYPLFNTYLTEENIHNSEYKSASYRFWKRVYKLKYFEQHPYKRLVYLAKKDIEEEEEHIELVTNQMRLIKRKNIHGFTNPGASEAMYECLQKAIIYTTATVKREEENDNEKREFNYESFFVTPNAKIAKITSLFSWDVNYECVIENDPDYDFSIIDVEKDENFAMSVMKPGELNTIAKHFGLNGFGWKVRKFLKQIVLHEEFPGFVHELTKHDWRLDWGKYTEG